VGEPRAADEHIPGAASGRAARRDGASILYRPREGAARGRPIFEDPVTARIAAPNALEPARAQIRAPEHGAAARHVSGEPTFG
jgi:hypothetical protein